MRRNANLGTVAAAITAVMVVAASSGAAAASGNGQGAGGGGGSGGSPGTSVGSDGTGDVFADLLVVLRDVHGVPVLTSFTVEGEEGPTVEYCVQPVSPTALPGLDATYTTVNEADGRQVYRIPLMGELIEAGVVADDEAEACDAQPAYAMYVSEAELERLNMARQPADVQTKKLNEVAIRLSTADVIGLDGAGRLTTDGVAIDASPDHAAIYASLMSSGKIPGLASSPARVASFTTWMLAAASVGTAAGKEVPLTIDSIQYYNRIVGVPAEHVPSDTWTVAFRQTEPSNGESFVDYSSFSYTRDDVYQGCATWLDVPSLTWKVSPISEVVDFAALPPVANDTNGDGVADTVTDIAGFAQLADDVRSVIVFLHEQGVIPGFSMDSVGTNTCAAQRAALTTPAVALGGVPTTLIQTDTAPVTASVYMPWAGSTIDTAQLRLTVEATDSSTGLAQPFTDAAQLTAVAADGANAGEAVAFDLVGGALVGLVPASGFTVVPGYNATTTFALTVAAGAPVGAYTLTLDLVDLGGGATLATDVVTTEVLDAALTVLWADTTEYAVEGTFVPMTARLFNPDLGGTAAGQPEVTGAKLRVTIDAAEGAFTQASQVAAWSDAVSMPFSLDAGGNLVGTWTVPVSPLPVPYDQLTTWYLNVAEGAPVGLYTITVTALDGTGSAVSSDITEMAVAAATSHEGGSGGGSGSGDTGSGGSGSGETGETGGTGDTGEDEAVPPVATIVDGPAELTSDTSVVFTLTADQDGATFTCVLDGGTAVPCSSPLTVDQLTDGVHTLAVSAVDLSGIVGPEAVWTWTVDTVAPTVAIVTAPAVETTADVATFSFTTTGSTGVTCSLDGAPGVACSSTVTYTDLATGSHTLVITAVDGAGNSTSSTHQWSVVTPPAPYVPAPTGGHAGRTTSSSTLPSWLTALTGRTGSSDVGSSLTGSRGQTTGSEFVRDVLTHGSTLSGLGSRGSGASAAPITLGFCAVPQRGATTAAIASVQGYRSLRNLPLASPWTTLVARHGEFALAAWLA
ncbi:hypothetical protein [Cellulomonas sp. P24]|uniref:hypothetical protein n=1 Tax=Cellulomonas sp. P24 TaxID=2885206 RepID=UPI00216AC239|nr:hypothetical protein [Cellulomonas sp. P24]MCR6494051.1 hypothetical protein [Cellulomonas sp. P24]